MKERKFITASNIYDPRIHLVRYKQLINQGENFNYAVLELRFAIEAIVYKQIKSYGNNIPNQILETFQPNKSFKLLTSFDENASRSIDLACAEDDGSDDPSTLNYENWEVQCTKRTDPPQR